MKNQSRAAAALAVSLLAACSGGGGTPATPQLPNTTLPVAAQPTPGTQPLSKSTAQFSIRVPRSVSTQSSSRQPKYVSLNTGSVKISVLSADGVAVQTPGTIAAIAYGAPGCTTNNSQPLTCAISVSAPTGHAVSFTVSTYQSNNGTGTVLSAATVSAPVVAGKLNTIPITLGGVAASITLSPSTFPLFADNQLHVFHLTVNALDASGATIVGATPLSNPISLSISGDTNSALQLSTTNVTTPGAVIELSYHGNVALDKATMTATSGSFTTSITLAPFHVSPLSAKMMPNGKTLPVTVHEGGFTGQFSVTPGDPSIVTTSVSATSGGTSTITLTSANAVQGKTTLTISDGTVSVSVPVLVAPVIFNDFSAGLTPSSQADFITGGPNGKVWFVDQTSAKVGVIDSSTGAISEFPLQPGEFPAGIVEGPDGNIYFGGGDANAGTATVDRINPSTGAISRFAVPNQAVISALTVGPDHNIWFDAEAPDGSSLAIGELNPTTQAISLFPVPANIPSSISSMTTGPDGRVWFIDSVNGTINAMDLTTHNVTVITSAAGFRDPEHIVSGPDGNLWFTDTFQSGAIGKIVPSTGAVTMFPITEPKTDGFFAFPWDIVSAHGKLWVTVPNAISASVGAGGSSIGSFDPATNTFTDYSFGMNPFADPIGITLGPDNELWLAENSMIEQAIIP